jgi:hypothetical protein
MHVFPRHLSPPAVAPTPALQTLTAPHPFPAPLPQVGKLKEFAKPVKGSIDIKNVAAISAGNDESIGQMIADALDKVGADGVLAIESSNSLETTVDVQEGMEIDRGYISPQFVTNSERMLVEYDNALVLITDMKIEAVKDIVPILEQVGARWTCWACWARWTPRRRQPLGMLRALGCAGRGLLDVPASRMWAGVVSVCMWKATPPLAAPLRTSLPANPCRRCTSLHTHPSRCRCCANSRRR